MIRRIGLINHVASWSLPDLSDVSGLDKAWKDWAQYETIKRCVKALMSMEISDTHPQHQSTLSLIPPRLLPLHVLLHVSIIPAQRIRYQSTMR